MSSKTERFEVRTTAKRVYLRKTARVYPRKTESILAGAEELFLRQGFAATSMQDVAMKAGVAKATVYSNFPNKEQLFAAVIYRRAEASRLDLRDVDMESRDVRKTLIELACAFLLDIYSRKQVELFQTVVADARRFPLLGKMMLEGPFIETHGKITRYFIDRIADGSLRYDDPELAAEYFIAIIKAGKHIPLIFSQPADVSPAAVRVAAARGVAIFLDGLRPPAFSGGIGLAGPKPLIRRTRSAQGRKASRKPEYEEVRGARKRNR